MLVDSLTVLRLERCVGMASTVGLSKVTIYKQPMFLLNGQLGLRVGQVCVASGYRSPFTS